MDLTLILLLTILIIPLQYLYKQYRKRKRISDLIEPLGGEKWYPIIGTMSKFIGVSRSEFYDVFVERNRLYGPFYRSWMGSTPAVHVMKAEHIEPILKSNTQITKGNNYLFFRDWLGDGLVTSTGSKWHHHRKMLTPAFHFTILDSFMEVFSERSQALTDIIAERSAKEPGKFFNVYPLLSHCALDIICETAMGVQMDSIRDPNSPYVRAVYKINELILHRVLHPYLHSNFIYNLTKRGREYKQTLACLHQFTAKVLKERYEKRAKGVNRANELSEEDILLGKKKRLAFLDILLEENQKSENRLTDAEIREEVDTFMFAGHDTTTVNIGWTLFLLASHPEIQRKVQQELDEIFYGEERPITPSDLLKMKYLDRVIKETQRLMPVVPIIGRTLTEDVIIDGRVIPAGVMLIIHIVALHSDPDVFPDPGRFDPDRFLPENCVNRHTYAFVPFSAGARNCIGQKFASKNTKTMLSSIFRKFNVKTDKKLSEVKYNMELTLRPQNGINVCFEERNKSL